jgi:biopolymer transport protein ExbD
MTATAPSRSPGGVITGINVTPLVDITLVLLIVFMVTARLIVRHAAIPLDLPKAATGESVQELLVVAVDSDGQMLLDGKTVDGDEALVSGARSRLRADRDVRGVLEADGSVPHRRVMHALDLLRQAGIARVAFAVAPSPSSSAATASTRP